LCIGLNNQNQYADLAKFLADLQAEVDSLEINLNSLQIVNQPASFVNSMCDFILRVESLQRLVLRGFKFSKEEAKKLQDSLKSASSALVEVEVL
jgi:hypothetical protein